MQCAPRKSGSTQTRSFCIPKKSHLYEEYEFKTSALTASCNCKRNSHRHSLYRVRSIEFPRDTSQKTTQTLARSDIRLCQAQVLCV